MTSKSSHNVAQPLIDALVSSVAQHAAILNGRRVWLACSGGRDSLSLAAICLQLYRQGKLPFLPQLLHVNHGLQAANDTWAKQVQAWADEQGMPCQILAVRVQGSDEQAARQARYDALMQAMNVGDVLILAHHRDDQVETVLMRLFNGAGVSGLSGMREWSDKTCRNEAQQAKTIHLWRPWLPVSRAQITDYAQGVGLDYIDDPTNEMQTSPSKNDGLAAVKSPPDSETINDRAWLRSVIMPQIQARFPQASSAIARSSQLLSDANSIVMAQAYDDLTSCLYQESDHSRQWQVAAELTQLQSILDINLILKLPAARQSALIHHWLSPKATDLPAPKRLVDDVLELCLRQDNDHQTCLHWQSDPDNSQHGYEIRRYRQRLFRLRSDWSAWLASPPMSQELLLKDMLFNKKLLKQWLLDGGVSKCCELKHSHHSFSWQLQHLSELTANLLVNLTAINSDNLALQFAPLPRDLSLTIVNRMGSKSGKKLLQALQLPLFMRGSVVLCSLIHKQGDDEAVTSTVLPNRTSLFILSMAGVTVLQSSQAAVIQSWLSHHHPVMRLRHNLH